MSWKVSSLKKELAVAVFSRPELVQSSKFKISGSIAQYVIAILPVRQTGS
jgi:hypothetical protein